MRKLLVGDISTLEWKRMRDERDEAERGLLTVELRWESQLQLTKKTERERDEARRLAEELHRRYWESRGDYSMAQLKPLPWEEGK